MKCGECVIFCGYYCPADGISRRTHTNCQNPDRFIGKPPIGSCCATCNNFYPNPELMVYNAHGVCESNEKQGLWSISKHHIAFQHAQYVLRKDTDYCEFWSKNEQK